MTPVKESFRSQNFSFISRSDNHLTLALIHFFFSDKILRTGCVRKLKYNGIWIDFAEKTAVFFLL